MIQTLDSRAIPAAGWMNVRLSVYQKLLLKITKRLLDSDCKLRLKIMKISIRQISGVLNREIWSSNFQQKLFDQLEKIKWFPKYKLKIKEGETKFQ